MISFLSVILKLLYTSKISLSKWVKALIYAGFPIAVALIVILVLKNLCNGYIAVADLSFALYILISLIRKTTK